MKGMPHSGKPSACARASFLLFVLGTGVAVFQCLSLPTPGFGAGVESVALARNLVDHGAFANPFSGVETGPSAHLAPLFPFFLAALIKIFGFTPLFALFASLTAALIHGVHAALLPWLSNRLYGRIAPGVCAAVLSTLLPALQFTPAWESIYAADGLMLFCLASAMSVGRPRTEWRKSLAVGVFAGLLILLNPVTILVCAPWLAFVVNASFRQTTAVVFGAALVCLPWTLRNHDQLHHWFFVRDNLGLELYSSNNDLASSSDALNHRNGVHRLLQLHFNQPEALRMKTLGEVEYNQERLQGAFGWVRGHPWRFTELTAHRVVEFWFPNPAGVTMYSYSIWFLTALSIPGIVFLYVGRHPDRWFFASVFAVYPLVYYFVQSSIRFRYPILWVSLLPAGYAATMVPGFARALLERFSIGARKPCLEPAGGRGSRVSA